MSLYVASGDNDAVMALKPGDRFESLAGASDERLV